MEQLSRCPENQTVTPGNSALLHCVVKPSLSHLYEGEWIVQLENGSVYYQHSLLTLQEKGLVSTGGEWVGSNLTLSILGTRETNNSRIKCRVYEYESALFSFTKFANFTVTGKFALKIYDKIRA